VGCHAIQIWQAGARPWRLLNLLDFVTCCGLSDEEATLEPARGGPS
jgi:hypothetical protein